MWKISCIKVNSTTSFDGIVYDGETRITGDPSILVGKNKYQSESVPGMPNDTHNPI